MELPERDGFSGLAKVLLYKGMMEALLRVVAFSVSFRMGSASSVLVVDSGLQRAFLFRILE